MKEVPCILNPELLCPKTCPNYKLAEERISQEAGQRGISEQQVLDEIFEDLDDPARLISRRIDGKICLTPEEQRHCDFYPYSVIELKQSA